jgi:hypothetical protein
VTIMRFSYVRYCTLSEVRDYWRGIKLMQMRNRSENGCSVRVTLCAHLTHTDTDTDEIELWKEKEVQ